MGTDIFCKHFESWKRLIRLSSQVAQNSLTYMVFQKNTPKILFRIRAFLHFKFNMCILSQLNRICGSHKTKCKRFGHPIFSIETLSKSYSDKIIILKKSYSINHQLRNSIIINPQSNKKTKVPQSTSGHICPTLKNFFNLSWKTFVQNNASS